MPEKKLSQITLDQIRKDIKKIISALTNLEISKIPLTAKLKEFPIKFTDQGLVSLTKSVRAYVQNINPSKNVTVSEIKKKDLTAGGVADLVFLKLKPPITAQV